MERCLFALSCLLAVYATEPNMNDYYEKKLSEVLDGFNNKSTGNHLEEFMQTYDMESVENSDMDNEEDGGGGASMAGKDYGDNFIKFCDDKKKMIDDLYITYLKETDVILKESYNENLGNPWGIFYKVTQLQKRSERYVTLIKLLDSLLENFGIKINTYEKLSQEYFIMHVDYMDSSAKCALTDSEKII